MNVNIEFVGPLKTSNFMFDELTVTKSDFVKTLSLIFSSDFTNFFLILAKIFFGWVCKVAVQAHSWEGGWDTGVGRSSSI
jgi:hypothetical protein